MKLKKKDENQKIIKKISQSENDDSEMTDNERSKEKQE